MKEKNNLEDRLVDFAVMVIDYVETLPKNLVTTHLGKQLLRSGTAPALNYGEAQSAESREDFIHKMKICLKELRESRISLRILGRKKYLPIARTKIVFDECNELISIFVTSVQTAGKNKPNG
ncbi:MAG: four helix bundle protein [Flavobacteriales bacterium]